MAMIVKVNANATTILHVMHTLANVFVIKVFLLNEILKLFAKQEITYHSNAVAFQRLDWK